MMDDSVIRDEIIELRSKLTGNLFLDADLHQEIYKLKVQLNPKIVESPELDDDEDCLSCGS
jgi:hypothetical protein